MSDVFEECTEECIIEFLRVAGDPAALRPEEDPMMSEIFGDDGLVAVDWVAVDFSTPDVNYWRAGVVMDVRNPPTDKMYNDLQAEVERTGICPRLLSRAFCERTLSYISLDQAQRWWEKHLKNIDPDLWDKLMALYRTLPDKRVVRIARHPAL